MNNLEFCKDLINFIDASPLNYFAVKNAEEILKDHDFEELKENKKWEIKKGGKYYVSRNGSALIAFTLSSDLTKVLILLDLTPIVQLLKSNQIQKSKMRDI